MKKGHIPIRMCIGCSERAPKHTLLRFSIKDGQLVIGGLEGRGYYLCRNPECLEKAIKRKRLTRILGHIPSEQEIGALRQVIEGTKPSGDSGEDTVRKGNVGVN